MKQEIKDIAVELAVRTTPAGAIAWYSQLSVTTVIAVILGVLQVAYLIRKWIREESEWGLRLKRWGRGDFTRPGDLE